MPLQAFISAYASKEAQTLCRDMAVADGNLSLDHITTTSSDAIRHIINYTHEESHISFTRWDDLARYLYDKIRECKKDQLQIKNVVTQIYMQVKTVAAYFHNLSHTDTNQEKINHYFNCIITTLKYAHHVLEALGYKASVHNISPAIQFTFVQNTNNHVQISLGGWTADYPSASTFLMTLFSCESFRPHSDNSPNMSGFCSPTIDHMMNNALSQTLNNRAESNRLWAKVDRALMQQAPAVPLVQTQNVILLSKRVHNVIITLNDELLFSQLQIQ